MAGQFCSVIYFTPAFLLPVTRAMVRESKLLILYEATSAIDYKTDATIIDADRIRVLDAGRIVEFDSPKELLKNKAGHLRALVDEAADKEHLRRMAEGVDAPTYA
ncbi:hypothetical protein BT96DRAFT_999660 [Gymnopus androsaceus JB14]|uniref:Uncharacterized protein n=1 Tax=Gymnopus androsaceus JB14 TaxID=1447944 RepID=A0A6A4H4T0_9AGAR|nr:hypothetical protein BT96DRAFT_999660 [Gymnopus androsaceus JB14]